MFKFKIRWITRVSSFFFSFFFFENNDIYYFDWNSTCILTADQRIRVTIYELISAR